MKADRRRKWGLSRMACKFVSVITLFFFSAGYVFALPSGQQVVNGQATFATRGNTLAITNSPNAIIHWQGFSINSNEAVKFIQQSASSAVLNRVIGQDPSRILGLLQSNGRVFLINPNGILIGQGARIDVNGLVASTLNISNQDFMAGRYNFKAGDIAGSIKNQGTIATPEGGKVYLIAPDIENSGLIESPKGDVILAAGHSVQLVDSLDPNLSVVVSAPEGKAVNLGQIVARSGRVGIYGGLISQKGIVRADSAVVGENGRIFFKASKDATLDAGSTTSAQGGGTIEVFADMKNGSVTVNGALDASAPHGGDGGFIETSAAKVTIGDSASVNTLAPYGKTGAWLIDPTNYTVASTGGDITGANLGTQLNSTNVTIATVATGTQAGDINVNDSVSWTTSNTLTLNAHNDINVNAPIASTNAMGAQTVLRADLDANGAGTVAFGGAVGGPAPGSVNMGAGYGTVSIFYNPTDYLAATHSADSANFDSRITGAIRTYHMLVNNVNDLQEMETNLAGTYALGRDIDAAATSGWNGGAGFAPIMMFSGLFDGLGHKISGLFINRPTTDSVGLFGFTTSSLIRNVGLVSANIAGQANVGGLVGFNNNGTINNSSSEGAVSGTDFVGGLAGVNYGGYISGSHSSGTVFGTGDVVGGLVGNNQEYGSIYGSYNTASVAGAGMSIGGLTGMNSYFSNIGNSYSTGAVSGTTNVGGLVGSNFFSGSITNSYSTGAVTGAGSSIGGLVGNNQSAAPGNTDPRFVSGRITDSYSSGLVSGTGTFLGGLVGDGGGIVEGSYWDTITSGQPSISAGGTGKTTTEMMTQLSFAGSGDVAGWDFTNTWWLSETNTRPFLRSEYSNKITNAHQLQLILSDLSASYVLANDIDMAEITRSSGMWNPARGFVPLGSASAVDAFSGIFDGAFHTISNLYINRPTTDYVGIFSGNSNPTIRNVGIVNVNVTGGFQVGGLIAHIGVGGSVSNSYVTGSVNGGSDVGGLTGLNAGMVSRSYSTATVNGTGNYVGGLIGVNYSTGTAPVYNAIVSDSFSTGAVTGSSLVGGLIGGIYQTTGVNSVTNSYSTGTVTGSGGGLIGGISGSTSVTGSYWDMDTSGRTTSAGGLGTGKTTAEMKSQATYTGWDFTNTWEIAASSYPSLRFQPPVLPPPTPQQLITGTLDAGVGKTIFFAVNGTLLPQTSTTGIGGFFSATLPDNTVPAGGALLAYVGGDSTVKGASVYLAGGGNITNLFIESSTLIAGSGSGNISNTTLGTAKGGLTSVDIPYSVFGTDLTLIPNFNFKTASGTPYALHGSITTTNGAQTYNGPVTLLGNSILSAGTGNIGFGGAVSGIGYNFTLNSQGIVSQTAPITVSGLELLGAGGTHNLPHAGNTVTTLAGDTGTVQFTNSAGTVIGTVNATAGLKTSGDLTIASGGPITQSAPLQVTGAATFAAGTQDIDLSNTANNFSSVGISSGRGVILRDAGALALHASAVSSDLTALAAGDILLGGLVNAGAGNVSLNTNGAIVNNMGGATSISAGTLSMSAMNGIGSSDPLKTAVHNLTASNSTMNNIEIDNTGVLTVGALVNNSSTGNIALANTGALTTDIFTITSGGAVSIIARSPLTIGAGGVTAFDTVTLQASPSGGADNLTVNGNIASANGNIMLSAGSSIVVAPGSTLSAPFGTITMTEGLNGAPSTNNLAVTGNETATSNTVSSLMTAMGKITSDENGDDENELKKKSSGSGQQSTDEKKADESKNYCN